jgi:hypothetical protein
LVKRGEERREEKNKRRTSLFQGKEKVILIVIGE